jgi:hypothetical protein
MALVECDECGGQVSSVAGSCPHCGKEGPFTWEEKYRQERSILVTGLLIGVLIWGVVVVSLLILLKI